MLQSHSHVIKLTRLDEHALATEYTLHDKMPSDGSPVYAHTYREILLLLAQASRYYISPRR